MTKYRKTALIEAVQMRGWENWNEVCDFIGEFKEGMTGIHIDPNGGAHFEPPANYSLDECTIGLLIPTKEGVMRADQGDWIAKGIQGEFWPIKPDIFAATYTLAEVGG